MDIQLNPLSTRHQKFNCLYCDSTATEEAYVIGKGGVQIHLRCCCNSACRSAVIGLAERMANSTQGDSPWPGKPE